MLGWLSSLFAPRWVRYQHRIETQYEREASSMVNDSGKELANPTIIAGRILARELAIAPPDAFDLALRLYADYRAFNVHDVIKCALIAKGPQPSDADLAELVAEMKRRFHHPTYWHAYYLDFVIVYLLEKKALGIEKGDYLISSALGTLPKGKTLSRLLIRTWSIAKMMARDEDMKTKTK